MSDETRVGRERKGEEGLLHALITDKMTGNYTKQFNRGNYTINSHIMLQVSEYFVSLHNVRCCPLKPKMFKITVLQEMEKMLYILK